MNYELKINLKVTAVIRIEVTLRRSVAMAESLHQYHPSLSDARP
jgi:hypothetical protein